MIKKNILTRLHDKYYDLSDFNHPGGPIALSLADSRDATGMFISHHPLVEKARLDAIMKKYEVEAPKDFEIEKDIYFDYDQESPFQKDVISKVKAYFQQIAKKRGISITAATKATPRRWFEYFLCLVCYCIALYYWAIGEWWALFVMPFTLWEISIHTFHDACHFAMSTNWWVNYLCPYFLAPVLSSPLDWYHQHNIGHHVHTDIGWKDPDLAHAPKLYRVHKSVKWIADHKNQIWKTPIVWTLGLPIGMALISPVRALLTKMYNRTVPYIKMSKTRWFIHMLGRLLAVSVWIWPYFYFSFWKAAIWTPVALYQLSIHFMFNTQVAHLSHETTSSSSRDWYTHQVLTALGFGFKSRWAFFYSGGLNYQIEHHLFPNVNHCHHQYLQPIVEDACKRHNIRYLKTDGYIGALKMHFGHVEDMSKNKIE